MMSKKKRPKYSLDLHVETTKSTALFTLAPSIVADSRMRIYFSTNSLSLH